MKAKYVEVVFNAVMFIANFLQFFLINLVGICFSENHKRKRDFSV